MKNRLTLEELAEQIRGGAIDTVLAAFPDHFGRLIGKRVTGWYFLKHMTGSGMHACDYLLSVDIEMNPLDDFEMAGWDKGYGDFHGVLDPNTLRVLPWLEGTAMVLADLEWEGAGPVTQSPRAILRKQIERAEAIGLKPMMGSELEFYLFSEPHEELVKRGFADPKPTSDYLIDYHILQTTRDERVIRRIRNSMNDAGIPIEFSKGEWGKGQHEINLLYADALEMADRHAIYKNGVKEIAWMEGYSATFMAKYGAAEAGSSFHLHTSLLDGDGENVFWDGNAKKESKIFRQFLGGMMKYASELFLFFASTVNAYKRYQANSFAPTRIAWSHDNRTTGFRVIGRGHSFRVENRMPGADANPYLAFAATIAAGLAGIEENLDCDDPCKGDAYKDAKLTWVPTGLREAADKLEASQLARKAFGAEVVNHYVRLARLEWEDFNRAVTDWERVRYFDRI